MTRDSDSHAPRLDPDALAPSVRWVVSVVFVAMTVVALALVPIFLGQRVSQVQRRAAEVLEPARLLSGQLSNLQAQQLARFQAFLLTGDRVHRGPYLQLLSREDSVYDELSQIARGMDLEVREGVARLSNASARWHLGHQAAFGSEEMRAALENDFARELGRYFDLQEATLELQETIQRDLAEGRRRIAATRTLQDRITLGLVVLALGAILLVAMVGRRLRVLTREAQRRRNDAIQARREIDALLEATGDGVMGVDLEGCCTSLNSTGQRLLGWREGEVRGRDIHDALFHSDAEGQRRPREDSPLTEVLEEGATAQSPPGDVLWRKDGTSFPARWTLQPKVDHGRILGAVLTFADMTEIRETEEALRRAVHARDEVVSIVSHDLKNPLGVVAGAAELLLDLPLEPEERDNQARIIRRSAERMGRLVGDLLDVARMEAGAMVVRQTAEPVGPLLEEVYENFTPWATERGISLELEVDDQLSTARMDPDRIHQALSNLLGNALKFTPEGGRVTLGGRLGSGEEEVSGVHSGTRRIAPGEPGENGSEGGSLASVVLSVSDTGPGIDPEDAEYLFDRFWQASRDDRTGAGLGLAIVRGIAEAHGGRVEVDSTPGEGATFRVILPAA